MLGFYDCTNLNQQPSFSFLLVSSNVRSLNEYPFHADLFIVETSFLEGGGGEGGGGGGVILVHNKLHHHNGLTIL